MPGSRAAARRDATLLNYLRLYAALLVKRPGEELAGFWGDLDVRLLAPGKTPPALAAVVWPALVEHNPRTLPRAGSRQAGDRHGGLRPTATSRPDSDPGAWRSALLD